MPEPGSPFPGRLAALFTLVAVISACAGATDDVVGEGGIDAGPEVALLQSEVIGDDAVPVLDERLPVPSPIDSVPSTTSAATPLTTPTTAASPGSASTSSSADSPTSEPLAASTSSSATSSMSDSPTSEPPTAPSSSLPVSTSLSTAPPPTVAAARTIVEQAWVPFARYAEVVLHHPSHRVERIGFHESNHDGARQMEPLAAATGSLTMETRNRGTGSRTAADVVTDPDAGIRAPVTGTVIRAGGYVLYCEHQDSFVVIEPDAHPGWEVKVLHINGLLVGRGDRVEAGVTPIAPGPTPLPFDSQVDEFTAEPSWPHVHIEIVDPSIPDRPSPGGGGC